MKKTHLAGIDVSSETLCIALEVDGHTTDPITLRNSAVDHRKLCRILTRGRTRARVCLEATGAVTGARLAHVRGGSASEEQPPQGA